VRVIDAKGKQIGVVDRNKALELAKKAKLDLVEIAPKARPPVVKIVDFGKFRYREEKKARAAKKKTKTGELKEIRFSPFIGEADYKTRIERVKEFLEDKDKVRIVVKFKGRQMGSKQYGYNLLKRVLGEFNNAVAIDMEPKFLGRHLMMVISPTGKKTATPRKAQAQRSRQSSQRSPQKTQKKSAKSTTKSA
jgi:translation initiation factor IF-3